MAELRRLATDCAFNAHLNEALRDKFVCRLRSEATQRHLLAEKDLTFTKAVEIAQGMEAAARDTQLFKSEGGTINMLSQQERAKLEKPAKPCYCCGKSNHIATQCKFKEATCHKCQKKDHIASVCQSRQANPQGEGRRPQPRQTDRTQWVDCNSNPEQDEEDTDFQYIESASHHHIQLQWKLKLTRKSY